MDRAELAVPRERTTLVDVLDRVLETGAALTGDVTLSVADIDLVRLSLRAFVAAVETAERGAAGGAAATPSAGGAHEAAIRPRGDPVEGSPTDRAAGAFDDRSRIAVQDAYGEAGPASWRGGDEDLRIAGGNGDLRIRTDPERVERGLAQLVMTVVGLLKDLMERQADRRVAAGTLTDEQVE